IELRAGSGTHCSFFFQAEDGIRHWSVTGVQTCALPICDSTSTASALGWLASGNCVAVATVSWPVALRAASLLAAKTRVGSLSGRSEERRVGKEWRSRGAPDRLKT